jgi:DNA-binding response OmpR family regulator
MEGERTVNLESGPGDETTVLLIEGDPLIRESYCRELARAGFRVRSASTGVAGLREVMANPPDLIFLEVRLPGLDGQIALEQIRSHEATRNLPVVVLSKCSEAELEKHGFRLRASEYLVMTGR